MTLRRVKIILNPHAGMDSAKSKAEPLRPLVEELGGADWVETTQPRQAIELARQAAEEGYQLVVAAGGDGTAHEVMNGILQVPAERRPCMAILPVGSGNDFCHMTGIPGQPDDALRQIYANPPGTIDLGLLSLGDGRMEYFGSALGIGFDAITTIRAKRLKFIRGYPMYLTAVFQAIILDHDSPRMQITTDQESWEETVVMLVVMNGKREGGGFFVAPQAQPDDGFFDYAQIRHVSRAMMLRILPEVMKGTHATLKDVRMGRCRKLDLRSDKPLALHADGEILAGFDSTIRQLSVEMIPQGLQIIRGTA
jgi:YegS/Rv2252/BmrU family lipid kinase